VSLDAAATFEAAPIEVANLRPCLEIRPYQMGQAQFSVSRVLQLWTQIIGAREACGHVAITRKVGASREIVAAGIGVFVTNEFAAAELARPQPGLNARILASIDRNESVIPGYEYLARANAAARLQQVIMYCSVKDQLLAGDEDTSVRGLLARTYAELFLGYRVQRMLTEVHGDADLAALAGYPSIEVASRYEDYYKERGGKAGDSVLCAAVGENFKNDPSSAAVPIYLDQPVPRFALSRGEKDLLKGALSGLDDTQLAQSLCRSEAALKRRWRQIFEKVANVDPALCPDAGGSVRGPQRRHHVLHYLRKHPEELRPFLSAIE
jgi:hypothetical protein